MGVIAEWVEATISITGSARSTNIGNCPQLEHHGQDYIDNGLINLRGNDLLAISGLPSEAPGASGGASQTAMRPKGEDDRSRGAPNPRYQTLSPECSRPTAAPPIPRFTNPDEARQRIPG